MAVRRFVRLLGLASAVASAAMLIFSKHEAIASQQGAAQQEVATDDAARGSS
jgi:hypothetical protein